MINRTPGRILGIIADGGDKGARKSKRVLLSEKGYVKVNVKKKSPAKFSWKIFAIGLISIVIGYIFLAANDITIAPILLVLGYCILIPVSFL